MPQPASLPLTPRHYLIQTNFPQLHEPPAKAVVCCFMDILVHSLQPFATTKLHLETAMARRAKLRTSGYSWMKCACVMYQFT
jgi:hypothetical protein